MNRDIKISKIVENVKKISLNDSYDFYAGNSKEEKISACVESEFKDLISMYRHANNNFDQMIKHALLSGPTFRKRKKAIKEYALLADEKFQNKYPNLSIGIEFAKFACEPFYCLYENLDAEEFFVEAAAIYILDELVDYSLEKEAFKYMPKDEDSLSLAVIHPEARDCMFSNELIESLCYLFQNQTIPQKNEESYLLTIDLAETKEYEVKKYDNPTSNKEKLLSILSLLNKENVERIINNFKKDFWDFFDIVLSIEDEYQKVFNNEITFIERRIKDLKNEIKNADMIFSDRELSMIKVEMYTKDISDSIDFLQDQLNTKHLLRLGSNFMYFDNIVFEEDIEAEYTEKLFDFEISNPYETCFAFMYLLTTNDPIVWLVNPCLMLLKKASLKLPWTKDYNLAMQSNEKEEALREKVFESTNDLDFSSYMEETAKENDELYKIKYNDSYYWRDYHNADENDLLKLNFPQFCFNRTEIIPPRNNASTYQNNKERLMASGFNEGEAEAFDKILYLLESAGEIVSFDSVLDDEIKEDTKDQINKLNIGNINKDKKIEVLNDRIKNLQNSYNSLKKEFEKYKNEYNVDSQEIYRLRELVYSLQNDKNTNDIDEKVKIDLPYYSPLKTVVLGGSDNWINKMKEAINNASFISSKQRINVDVIKNAEMIWIQIIQLSHSDFYAVTSYAKAHHIPIYYFSYSNIEKCINQFVEQTNK